MHEKAVLGSRWSLFTVVALARVYCIASGEKPSQHVTVRLAEARPNKKNVKGLTFSQEKSNRDEQKEDRWYPLELLTRKISKKLKPAMSRYCLQSRQSQATFKTMTRRNDKHTSSHSQTHEHTQNACRCTPEHVTLYVSSISAETFPIGPDRLL